MPDTRIQHCLDLCALASTLGGEKLSRVLAELQMELHSLQNEGLESALEHAGHDSDAEWMHEPVITMDMAGYLTGWNRGAQLLFGYTPGEAIGQHILFLYTDEPRNHNSEIHELFLDHLNPMIEVQRRKKSGEIFRAKLTLSHILDEQNEPIGMAAHFSEIVDHQCIEGKQRLYARIIEDCSEGFLITDADERIVSVNQALCRITGYPAREIIGESPDLLRSTTHGIDLRAQIRTAILGESGDWHGKINGRKKNGEMFSRLVSIGIIRDAEGAVSHAFSIFSDISALRAAEEHMHQIVNYDSLTGLPNRTLFHQLVDQTLATARRNNDHSSLLVIDLYRFTLINDTLGHDVGDELLRQVGERFRKVLREEDILARIGGDEFVVALVSINKREHSGLVAEKLLASLETPFMIESHTLHISASIGIAVFPEDGPDTAALLRFADVAMKRVQGNSESGYLFYCPEMNARAKEKWQLENELHQALNGHELLLHYQPKVSLRNGKIVGAEALIRWFHPEHGMVAPQKFIPLAEETGLIFELGSWILEEACRQIRCWRDSGLELVPIALNLSARQFDSQLPGRIQAAIERHGIPCELLRLEITESLLVRGSENVIPIMNELVAMGFNLSLDDFGTGYSSLAYLKKFPITTLKIDRAFVIGVPEDKNDCAIAQAIVTMGKQLRQEIVAEGVETQEQMAFLRDLGCDQLQGYLFSPPIKADTFEHMLRQGLRLDLS